MGFNWQDDSKLFKSGDFVPCNRLKRVHHDSGNLGLVCMESQYSSDIIDYPSDSCEMFSEEEEDYFMESKFENDEKGISEVDKSRGNMFLSSASRWYGIYVSAWVWKTPSTRNPHMNGDHELECQLREILKNIFENDVGLINFLPKSKGKQSLAPNMYACNPAMDSSYFQNYGRFKDSRYYNVNGVFGSNAQESWSIMAVRNKVWNASLEWPRAGIGYELRAFEFISLLCNCYVIGKI
ncbi:hypothetical protein Syun_019114 [Stephania yunnanensis]|uniref:Uncharacterized protein n=1 Tax=Stephania yunnanensis TaxID=152371 RepID=A0AAP0ITH3_9MAGN